MQADDSLCSIQPSFPNEEEWVALEDAVGNYDVGKGVDVVAVEDVRVTEWRRAGRVSFEESEGAGGGRLVGTPRGGRKEG